jgi:hypothetical protein
MPTDWGVSLKPAMDYGVGLSAGLSRILIFFLNDPLREFICYSICWYSESEMESSVLYFMSSFAILISIWSLLGDY